MSLHHSKPGNHEHLASGFEHHALQLPAAPALTLWQATENTATVPRSQFSYRELSVRADQCQLLLQKELPAAPADTRVAWSGGNSAGLAAVYIACVRFGLTLVLFEPNWPSAVREAAEALVRPALMLDESQLQQNQESAPKEALIVRGNASSRFLIGFTSGSSGTPKAFVRAQRSWLATLQAAREEFAPEPGQVVLAPGPLAHGLSFYAMVETLDAGGHFMGLERFDARVVLDVLQGQAVHTLVVVPTMLVALLDRLNQQQKVCGLARIVSAGAKLSPALRKRVQQHFPGTRVSEYYGASELSFVTVARASESTPPDSVGRAFFGVELELRAADGRVVSGDEEGTVWVRSQMLAEGMLVDADTLAPLVDGEGWATVGDIGRLDRDGYLTLVDRASSMIITGGLNVYPADVERVLRQHPDLVEVVVIGVPDDYWGERLCAVCELATSNPELVAELKQRCSDLLAPHQRPARYYRTLEWPWTTSTKIDRKQIRQQVCDESAALERVA